MKRMVVVGTWKAQGRGEVSFWWALQRQERSHQKVQEQMWITEEDPQLRAQGLKQVDQRVQRNFLPEEEDLGRKEA